MFTKYGTNNLLIMLAAAVLLFCLAIFAAGGWLSWLLASAGTLLALFTLWFFRDPERQFPDQNIDPERHILAPADGTIVEITKLKENVFMKSDAVMISIFLSPLDVHVNRIPVSGVIKYFKYHPGDYLVAYHPKSSDKNEQTHIGIENSRSKVFFKQIVGIMARRLVWDISEGDTVETGQRFGMMKFGSRVDVFVNTESDILVKKGQKVRAVESILARLPG